MCKYSLIIILILHIIVIYLSYLENKPNLPLYYLMWRDSVALVPWASHWTSVGSWEMVGVHLELGWDAESCLRRVTVTLLQLLQTENVHCDWMNWLGWLNWILINQEVVMVCRYLISERKRSGKIRFSFVNYAATVK